MKNEATTPTIRVGDRVFFHDSRQPDPQEGLGTALEIKQEEGIVVLLSDVSGKIEEVVLQHCMRMESWR